MTLAVAFIRKLPDREDREELVFASDSRLSAGQRLDHGTKIFQLPRSDALLSFAGDTSYAYPLALQLVTAIAVYPASADRRFPLGKARGHMVRVFEQMYRSIHGLPAGQTLPHEAEPPVQFLFGGYKWQDKAFGIWYITLDDEAQRFVLHDGGRFFFIGDRDAVHEARRRTMRRLEERSRSVSTMDMEPFEALRDVIQEGRHSHVGGAPQIAKVYQYMATAFFATLWPSNGRIVPHVFGRPLLPQESCAWSLFDPQTLHFRADAPVQPDPVDAPDDE